jgi:hypothetical protein
LKYIDSSQFASTLAAIINMTLPDLAKFAEISFIVRFLVIRNRRD